MKKRKTPDLEKYLVRKETQICKLHTRSKDL